jgi:serine/threonine protein kinase
MSSPSSQDDTYFNDRGVTSNESIHVRRCNYSEELCKQSLTKPELDVLRGAACEYAKDQYQADFASSRIIDSSKDFPKFAAHEIVKGNILGKGAFGVVYVVNGFDHNINYIPSDSNSQTGRPESITSIHEETDEEDSTENTTDLEMESRKFIAEHCYRKNGEDPRYAIKQLQPNIKTLFQGILDLNAETRFLSSLPHHSNIIKLRALSQGNPFDPDYFIVIDRLYDTLEERLQKWKLRRSKGWKMRYLKRRFSLENRNQKAQRTQTQRAQLYHDRLWVAYDLSSALAHLHEHSIIHRDIKPDNIGFDIVSGFHFGISRRHTSCGRLVF